MPTPKAMSVPDPDLTGAAVKLNALRGAADAGIAGIERGDCHEFSSMSGLVAHLDEIAEQVIAAAKRRWR